MFLFNHFIAFVVFSLFLSIFIFSALLTITEKTLSQKVDGSLDSWKEIIWYVAITMTTIGYGDKTAKTLPSRVFVMFLVIWGNFWTSILMSSVIPYIQFNMEEAKAFNLFERLIITKKLKTINQDIITYGILMKNSEHK